MTDQSLLLDFIAETSEHLEQIEKGLLALEQDSGDKEVLNDVFRSVHTIKGSSEYLGMARIAELTHKLENLLDDLRQGRRAVDDELIDLLIASGDRIGLLVEDLEREQSEQAQIDDLIERIESLRIQTHADGKACADETGLTEFAANVSDAEIYQEDYDEELFGIFIDQLSEGLTDLASSARLMWSGKAEPDLLKGCIDCLEALRSSANYMGYDQLKEVYQQWLKKLDEAGTLFRQGGQIDWRQVAEDTMAPMLEKVAAFFAKSEKIACIDLSIKRASKEAKKGEQDKGAEEGDDAEIKNELFFDDIEVEELDEEYDLKEYTEQELDLDIEEEQVVADIDEKTEPIKISETDQSLLLDFIAETSEHLEQIEKGLLALEQDSGDKEVLNDVFRSVHTIKGSSEYLGMARIAELTHKLENLLDDLRQGRRAVDDELIDLLIASGDRIGLLVEDLEREQSEQAQIDDLIERIESLRIQTHADGKEPDGGADLPDDEAETGEGEIYDDEYDEELFGIFVDQLSEGLSAVVAKTRLMWSGEVDTELVKSCFEQLGALKSSANYMGYDKLVEVYELWLEKLDDAETIFKQGGQVDWRNVAEETMIPMLEKVKSLFAKVGKIAGINLAVDDAGNAEGSQNDKESAAVGMGQETLSLEDLGIDLNAIDEELDLADVDLEQDDELISRLEDALEEKLDALQSPEDSAIVEDMENVLFSSEQFLSEIESAPEQVDDVEAELFSESDVGTAGKTPVDEDIEKQGEVAEDEKRQKPFFLPDVKGGDRRSRLGRRRSDKLKERLLKHSIRVDAAKIDTLMNQVGELVVSRAWFAQLYSEMRELQKELSKSEKLDKRELKRVKELTMRVSEATVALGRVANELQEGVMKVRMLPIEQLFSRYPRLVHDLVRETGKKVNLEMVGEDTELDKVVIEEIADPLVHIIRNAIDHGIESVEERIAQGKPETGTLHLYAYHEGNHVVIEVSDDGRGIDLDLVKTHAVEKEYVTADELERMSEKELLALIMMPGFSTAHEITHTSGRGVGMDVVKANIEKLNGTVEIESQKGLGTRFRVKIPLTLAIIPALLVNVSGELFTVPLSTVDETLRIDKQEISTIEGVEVFQLRETTIPLIRLSELFGMQTLPDKDDRVFVVVVNTGVKRVGLIVDELNGREEVVIKPLEDYLQENSGFSGATILGDGSISLILDVYQLFNLSIEKQARKKAATLL